MPQKSLFSRLKAGEKIFACFPDKEPFEIEWGPRGAGSHLTKRVGDASTRVPMTEAECYAWISAEEGRGLVEVSATKKAKAPTKKNPPKKSAKK